jgi:hypothetical protein
MRNFMKNFYPKNEGPAMEKTKITYTVVAEFTYNDKGDWKRKVRAIRKGLKENLAKEGAKILKIDTKEG